MTSPIQFPTVTPGGVIQDPGIGGTIQQGLAGVLAQMQIDRENQFRQQELVNAQAQQQALQQYYQAQAAAEQQRLGMEAGEQAIIREGQKQVGGAIRAALNPQTQGLFSQILGGGAQAMPPQSSLPSIFTGVSDENLSAAVKEVQGLTPKPPELPTSAQEFQFYNYLQRVDPSGRLAQDYALWHRAPQQPSTVVNVGGDVEKAYGVEGAKADIALRTEAEKLANASAAAFPSLDEGYKLLSKGNVVAGLASGAMLQWHRVLATVGVDGAKMKVRDTQTASRLFYEGVAAQLAQRTFGSGTAVSDNDRKAAESMAGVDFSKDIGALKFIARINVGLNLEKIEGARVLLKQQQLQYPEYSRDLQIRIDALDKKLKPIWARYNQMREAEKQPFNPRQVSDSLFSGWGPQ